MPDRIEDLALENNNEDYITFPGGRQIRTQEKLTRDLYNNVASPLRRGGNRIEELFEELATSTGRQQQFQSEQQLRQMEAEREIYDTDEARRALEIAGIIGLLALTKGRSGGAGLPLNKAYGAVGKDFTKFIDPLKSKLSGVFGRSGSGVGADVVGRYALPKTKPSVVTKQGPRGPINIDSPKQIPLKGLKDPRYTKGISATERAQLPNPYRVRESSRLQSPRDPYYPLEAKNVPEGLTKATLNRGRPYPGPHLTVEEGLKKLVPLRVTGKAKEATWYQHPRTGDLYQYHYGTGALARGFYKRGKDAGGTPQYARKAAEEFNPNIIGARTPVKGGGITATKAAREARVEIKKLERWRKGHQNKVIRGEAEFQEGVRSGYEPGIKGGGKMRDYSMKRIREIDAKLKELYKLLE
jgi:hypothetical protein